MVSYSHLQARLYTRVQVLKVQKEGRKYCEFLILIHILIKHFPPASSTYKKVERGAQHHMWELCEFPLSY